MRYFFLLLLILTFQLPDNFFFYEVRVGDTLWAISERFLDGGWNYPEIVKYNSRQILNPDLIHPGQVFIIPQ